MKERTFDERHFERLYLKKEIQVQKLTNKLQAIELEQARKEARKQARKARKKKKELREYSDSLAVSGGELVSAQHTLASILASFKQQEQEQAFELVQESEAYNWEQVETSSEQQEDSKESKLFVPLEEDFPEESSSESTIDPREIW